VLPQLWLNSIRVVRQTHPWSVPTIEKTRALRQAKLGVTRSVRLQKVNALDDHRNSVERNWFASNFQVRSVLELAEPVRTWCALSLAADKKSMQGWCPLRRRNLRVEENARARDVTS
jgi:hypothetical protein